MGRKPNCFTYLLVALFVLGIGMTNCYADSFTMNFTGVGPGLNTHGVYTYPYTFTITPKAGGQPFDMSLMCISYNREITIPETWTADRYLAGDLGQTYEEAAYLWTVAAANWKNNPNEAIDANWAAWSLFPGGPAIFNLNQATLLGQAANVYAQYAGVYVWKAEDGTQSSGGWPQDFVGGTPEPGTWALLGTGLMGIILMLYSRKRSGIRAGQFGV